MKLILYGFLFVASAAMADNSANPYCANPASIYCNGQNNPAYGHYNPTTNTIETDQYVYNQSGVVVAIQRCTGAVNGPLSCRILPVNAGG